MDKTTETIIFFFTIGCEIIGLIALANWGLGKEDTHKIITDINLSQEIPIPGTNKTCTEAYIQEGQLYCNIDKVKADFLEELKDEIYQNPNSLFFLHYYQPMTNRQ